MADTEFFESTSGVIFEIDIPDPAIRGQAMKRERHDEKVASGALRPVTVTPVKVDVVGGGYRWEIPAAKPAPAKRPAPKPDVSDE